MHVLRSIRSNSRLKLLADGVITAKSVADALQRKILLYDKSGEEHSI